MTLLYTDTWPSSAPSFWCLKLGFVWLLSQNCYAASTVWTAYMNISFHVGSRMLSELGETGVFGRNSSLKRVEGVVVRPEGKTQKACNPNTSFYPPRKNEPWIALIERGGCTFTQKIKVASENGARGVIIYNFRGTGNQIFPMSHLAFDDIVVVMIGNLKGREILNLLRKGVYITVMVEVGRKHIWINHYFVYFMITTTATLAYFTFHHIRRIWVARIEDRRLKQLRRELKKALGQLQVRVLKEDDEEIHPNAENCVICLEPYKPNDTVRILTCYHFFHKNCIDPWILAHGTCPLCKCDILEALDIQMDIQNRRDSLQVLMANELPGTFLPLEEETNNELPPTTTSGKVTHVQEHPASPNTGSQPPAEEETGRPSLG
ncbi:E3 ubiquitin-protein ligase RNF133 [Lemmus lemmus]